MCDLFSKKHNFICPIKQNVWNTFKKTTAASLTLWLSDKMNKSRYRLSHCVPNKEEDDTCTRCTKGLEGCLSWSQVHGGSSDWSVQFVSVSHGPSLSRLDRTETGRSRGQRQQRYLFVYRLAFIHAHNIWNISLQQSPDLCRTCTLLKIVTSIVSIMVCRHGFLQRPHTSVSDSPLTRQMVNMVIMGVV